MAARKKNLLEAFQTSTRPSAGEGGGSAPASSGGEPPLFHTPRTRSLPALPPWFLAVIGLVLAFALGFVAGRGSRGEAEASEPEPPAKLVAPNRVDPRPRVEPPKGAAQPTTPPAPATESARIEDSALFDTKNQHTVVVIAYASDKQDLAWATYEHLTAEGLPAFPPVISGKSLIVLCGAAPTSTELEDTEKRLRELVRDGGKPYATAYRARIDKLIPRTKPGESP